MREWHVYHSKDGFGVSLVERPTWKYLLEQKLPNFLIDPPSFLWNVSIGKKQLDPEDPAFITNSIAGQIIDVGQKVFNWVARYEELARFPISDEMGIKLWPVEGDWLLDMWLSDDEGDEK